MALTREQNLGLAVVSLMEMVVECKDDLDDPLPAESLMARYARVGWKGFTLGDLRTALTIIEQATETY